MNFVCLTIYIDDTYFPWIQFGFPISFYSHPTWWRKFFFFLLPLSILKTTFFLSSLEVVTTFKKTIFNMNPSTFLFCIYIFCRKEIVSVLKYNFLNTMSRYWQLLATWHVAWKRFFLINDHYCLSKWEILGICSMH